MIIAKRLPLEPTDLEKAIAKLLSEMQMVSCVSAEYAKMADQLTKLYKLKEIDSPRRVSPDTMATIVAHLTGIMLIIGQERVHVITTKALQFVMKLK